MSGILLGIKDLKWVNVSLTRNSLQRENSRGGKTTNDSNLLLGVHSKDACDVTGSMEGETPFAEQTQRNFVSDFTFFWLCLPFKYVTFKS